MDRATQADIADMIGDANPAAMVELADAIAGALLLSGTQPKAVTLCALAGTLADTLRAESTDPEAHERDLAVFIELVRMSIAAPEVVGHA
ncbi:hypothetical protein [Limobrevibacterium gyesilva]|uniref:Uncharacterized protein n=1 Tax=Limobrevibacterium gyesilva TaxID=2991712 RepID=A0AA41YRU8_9PROT|nr:hypothetical protein [Limobrevibacterium gyesilva]MCW3477397.1 hypothetical protein [Limobrevibacterium gyesilva]